MAHKLKDALFIDGNWVKATSTFPVYNPATEEVLGLAPAATAEQVDQAVKAASEAFRTWGTTTGTERAVYLRAIAEQLRKDKARLGEMESRDNGKPLPEALWDMDDVATCFDYFAGLAEELDGLQDRRVDVGDEGFHASLRYEPAGVVGAIKPFNYPLLLAAGWAVAPALAAGCTVVLKPSEVTPFTALEFGGICQTVGLPPGVVNVVTGYGNPVGATLAAHPLVDKLSFTGSVATGTRIMHTAADSVTNITLELGGKSAAIVFDDTNLERTAEWIMFGCFWTNGQICSATSRLLVADWVADRLLELLKQETAKIKIGDPLEDGVKLGPLVSKQQQEKVLGFVERAKGAGATVLAGGNRPAHLPKGYFVEPTILVDVSPEMEVWKEEIFGPVLSVMRFSTEEEAIRLANDSQYGLAAAVFSPDPEQLNRVAKRLRTGIVWQNCSQPAFCQLPWGGFKRSGIGRDLGRAGFNAFLEQKQVVKYNKEEDLGWYRAAKL